MRLLIFGDSIAQGFNDPDGGWAQRIVSYFHGQNKTSDLYVEVFNLGISGDTVGRVQERFKNEVDARNFMGETEYAFIFAVGVNDALISDNKTATTPESFKKQASQLLTDAQMVSSKILVLGLLPVVEELTNPILWSSRNKSYTNETIREYNTMLSEVCIEQEISFLDLNTIWSEAEVKKYLDDGVHPNAQGHEVLAKLIREPLLDILQ